MSSEWLTFSQATEIARNHLGIGASIGRSEALTRAALASGEVRFDPPVLLTSETGMVDFSLRPGPLNPGAVRRDRTVPPAEYQISKDDLLDWLNQHHPLASSEAPKPQTRTQFARNRAREACAILWPVGIPATLANQRVSAAIQGWLKDDCKNRGVAVDAISDTTILRAVGRRRK